MFRKHKPVNVKCPKQISDALLSQSRATLSLNLELK